MKFLCLLAALVLSSAFLLPKAARAGMADGYPDAILCDFSGGTFVAYLHGVLKDGTAAYLALNGQGANISKDGIVVRKGASCDGKSVADMRRDGKAFDFTK